MRLDQSGILISAGTSAIWAARTMTVANRDPRDLAFLGVP